MKTPTIAALALFLGLVAADCHGDNCANHVTGTFAGIGVPISARISLCNSFLRTTVRPPPSVVPTFAASQCPEDGQFASACVCWTRVTARTTTLPASTVTVTATVSVNVACSPAATAVSNSTRFPCSNGFGMCSCLRTGDGKDDSGVCVRVGSGFFDDPGSTSDSPGDSSDDATFWNEGSAATDLETDEDGVSTANWNVTGPCWFARECGVDHSCRGNGNVCVFDGSCACGKRRCYQAIAGCRGLELPSYEANGGP
ncbi:hypothetical protein ESCO_002700 [Escovopsis weberi]|uniref:Uncharacterized protein n=1 Tax=Escovopsis weberi TaxID=150374 RepID=A0A0M8N1Y8_ESCWE|nr:hypothetical protein ESCO_002700 [Escovopsis weberi]